MKKYFYAFLLLIIILAGCTSGDNKEKGFIFSSETRTEHAKEIVTILGTVYFNSTLIPKTSETVYYVITGDINNESVISIRYLTSSEASIGSRQWSPGQKCISWDAAYDWMSANIKTNKYTIKLIPNNNANISIVDAFITKDIETYEKYKQDNCF